MELRVLGGLARVEESDTTEFLEWARAEGAELFLSAVVLDEIARAPEDLFRKLRDVIANVRPTVLPLDDEAERLATAYTTMGALPPAKTEDAQHVAIAVVNELDILVSWNYRHLVNVRRREAIQHISAMKGYYKPLHIVAPPEVPDARW